MLVVGASATGVQLAHEIQQSGRQVTLAVGEHVRLPRRCRRHDILWWMDASGVWNERYDEIDRARKLPSPQLVGTPDGTTLDLNALADTGMELVGRWAAVRDNRTLFSGGLRNQSALANLKMNRLLDTFDAWAAKTDLCTDRPPERFEPTTVRERPRLELDLASREIRSVVWTTGFRQDYRWLHVPCSTEKGGFPTMVVWSTPRGSTSLACRSYNT